MRLQVWSFGGREDAVGEDALRGSRWRLQRLQRLWTPAYRRDAGAAWTRRWIAAVHAAFAADSARHSLHHLREAGEGCAGIGIGAMFARVLRRQALGARRGRGAAAADQIFAPHEFL